MGVRFTTETEWVVNKNHKQHVDWFDSVEYAFPPNVAVEVPKVVAGHFFGYRRPDGTLDNAERVRAMSRNAWNLDQKNGNTIFANFQRFPEEPKALKVG